MPPLRVLSALAAAVLAAAPLAAETPARLMRGPIELGDLFPLSTQRGSFTPRTPDLVSPGELELAASFGWTNTFVENEHYDVDAENRELVLTVRGAPAAAFDLSLEVPVAWRGGGVLDGLIDGWHEFFHLPRGGRNRVEDDTFLVAGTHGDGSAFVLDEEGPAIGNPAITGRWGFSRELAGQSLSAALSVTLDLPAPSVIGHDGVDTVTGVQLAWGGDTARVYAGAAHVYAADEELEGVRYERHRAEFFGYVDYVIIPRLTAVAGLYAASPIVDDLPGYPSALGNLDIGIKAAIDRRTVFELLVRENIFGGDGVSDVVFGFGLRRTFSVPAIVRGPLSGDTIAP